MASRFHRWWMLIKKYWTVVISSVFVIFIALIVAGYVFNWDWMGLNGYSTISESTNLSSKQMTRTEVFLPGKTFWDWLQLLFVPSVLTLGAVWLTARQNHDRNIALDNQRETELEQYIDKMSELLLEKKLRESGQIDEVRNIARVRTLTMLPRLDKERKRTVLRFLYESGLIDKDKQIIDLSVADLSNAYLHDADLSDAGLSNAVLYGADLRKAGLSDADLRKADLRKADLSDADLGGADLSDADLSDADLYKAILIWTEMSGAKLSGARLGRANLSEADLYGADLSGADLSRAELSDAVLLHADLSGADLSDANLRNTNLRNTNLRNATVTPEQLGKAQLSKDTILPDGSKHSD